MSGRTPLLRLFPVLVLNVIELGIALPVLPALALALGGDAIDVGLLYALQSLGQFVMAPAWGGLSDRFGRKKVLTATFVLAGIAELLTALAPSLFLLYAARLFVGFCAGNVATASALIADVTSEGDRSKGMALVGISFGLGFTIGPGIGAAISLAAGEGPGLMNTGLPFAAAGLLSFGTAIIGLFTLQEPDISPTQREDNRVRLGLRQIRRLLRDRGVRMMCALFFLYTTSVSIMEGTFFLYMEAVYGFGEEHVGGIFAGLGLLMALFQGGVGRVARHLGDRKMTIVGGTLLGIGLLIAPAVEILWFLLMFLGISTLGRALVHPGMLAIGSRSAPREGETGRVMGVLQSAGSLGRIVGPAAGGFIFAHVAHAAPFVAGGGIMLLAILWWALAGADRFRRSA